MRPRDFWPPTPMRVGECRRKDKRKEAVSARTGRQPPAFNGLENVILFRHNQCFGEAAGGYDETSVIFYNYLHGELEHIALALHACR